MGLALVTAASVFIGAAGGGSKVTSLGSKVASLGISASPKFIPVLKGGFVPPLHKHLYNDKAHTRVGSAARRPRNRGVAATPF